MSLAMYAAPFDNESSDYKNNDNDNIINKKRQTHNKTQKHNPKVKFDQEKVNSVLEKIHNDSIIDDNDDLGSFNPPPNPESSGVNKTIATEEMSNMTNTNNLNNENLFRTLGKSPSPNNDNNGSTDNLSLNNFNMNYGNNKSVEEYYNKMLPVKNINNRQYYSNNSNVSMTTDNSQDMLIKKLNYMINLLEEQQDERTNNVTEEVVLYSFLGIFIIFVVDSFARVGKYVR
jgi:hypothetical protein